MLGVLLCFILGIILGYLLYCLAYKLGREVQLHNDLARAEYAFEETSKAVARYGEEHNIQVEEILKIINSNAKAMKIDMKS